MERRFDAGVVPRLPQIGRQRLLPPVVPGCQQCQHDHPRGQPIDRWISPEVLYTVTAPIPSSQTSLAAVPSSEPRFSFAPWLICSSGNPKRDNDFTVIRVSDIMIVLVFGTLKTRQLRPGNGYCQLEALVCRKVDMINIGFFREIPVQRASLNAWDAPMGNTHVGRCA